MIKHFHRRILLHLIAILALMAGGLWWYTQRGPDLPLALIAVVLIIAIASLVRLVNRTNKELADFLLNIKYDDYAIQYRNEKMEAESFNNLHDAFNTVTDKFRSIRAQKEAQFQMLQAIVENVDSGLICFDGAGKTVLMNRALQSLLRKSHFPNLESVGRYHEGLYDTLRQIQPGERKLVRLVVGDQMLQLAIRTATLKFADGILHLYALHNIQSELEEQEMSSWQKLIRILTHEIMNSVAPIVSLSATAGDLLEQAAPVDPERLQELKAAIAAIRKRSEGLLHFTETYRQLTKIPAPRFAPVEVAELLDRVSTLLKPAFAEHNISLSKTYPAYPLVIQADPELMEQVLINLLNNAIYAVTGVTQPRVELRFFKDAEGATLIQIEDNGPGITPEVQEQIFTPFFTTKKEGSGIGLSLSRQIIYMHKGSMSVVSKPGEITIFTIRI
ncbi:MAG: GHKL domain-containing protein [Saprospiraceae bacterium]|nr:GHKL domain-containing protein [Saprospiraceae bacterium]